MDYLKEDGMKYIGRSTATLAQANSTNEMVIALNRIYFNGSVYDPLSSDHKYLLGRQCHEENACSDEQANYLIRNSTEITAHQRQWPTASMQWHPGDVQF